jgi:hypothetical protein
MVQDETSAKTLDLTVTVEKFSHLMFALVMSIRELDKLYENIQQDGKNLEQSVFLQSKIAELTALVHKFEIYIQNGALINLVERNLS